MLERMRSINSPEKATERELRWRANNQHRCQFISNAQRNLFVILKNAPIEAYGMCA